MFSCCARAKIMLALPLIDTGDAEPFHLTQDERIHLGDDFWINMQRK
jgi:hypothetical protein